jgi:hypothetical protein
MTHNKIHIQRQEDEIDPADMISTLAIAETYHFSVDVQKGSNHRIGRCRICHRNVWEYDGSAQSFNDRIIAHAQALHPELFSGGAG